MLCIGLVILLVVVFDHATEHVAKHAMEGALNKLGQWLAGKGLDDATIHHIVETVVKFGDTIKPEDVQEVISNLNKLLPKVEEAVPVFTDTAKAVKDALPAFVQAAQAVEKVAIPIAVGTVMAGVGAMTTAAATITIAVLAGLQLKEQKKTNTILNEHTALMKNMEALLAQQLEEQRGGNKKLEAIYHELEKLNDRFSKEQEIQSRKEKKLLTLFNSERYPEGVVYYSELVDTSIDPKVHLYGALLLCKTANNFNAIKSLKRVVKYDRGVNSSYFLYCGLIYMQLGWHQKAIKNFRKALQKRPNLRIAQTMLLLLSGQCDATQALRMIDESLNELQALKLEKPKSKKVNMLIEELAHYRAVFYSKQGLVDKSICELENLLKSTPKHNEKHYLLLLNLAEEYLKVSNVQAAIRCFGAINEAYPTLSLDLLLKAYGIKALESRENIAEIQYALAWELCYQNANIKFCNDMLFMQFLRKAAFYGTCAKAMKLYGDYSETSYEKYLWYQRAAKAGDTEAQTAIVGFHNFSTSYQLTYDTVVSWQNVALLHVREEYSLAQYYSGMEYLQRYRKNPQENLKCLPLALAAFEKSAAIGNLLAIEALAYGCQCGFFTKNGSKFAIVQPETALQQVPETSYTEAYTLYSNTQILPYSQYNLALLYLNGRGVRKNHRTACAYYRQAWRSGIRLPNLDIAFLFIRGMATTHDHALITEFLESLVRSNDQSVVSKATWYQQTCLTTQLVPRTYWYHAVSENQQYTPGLCSWGNKQLVEVHHKKGHIFYRIGELIEGNVVWQHNINTQIEGCNPAIAITKENMVILMYKKDNILYLRSGAITADRIRFIKGIDVLATDIATYNLTIFNDKILVVFQKQVSNCLYYLMGDIDHGRSFIFLLPGYDGYYDHGKHPSVAFCRHQGNWAVVEVHESSEKKQIFCNVGTIVNYQKIEWETTKLTEGFNPRVAVAANSHDLFVSYRDQDGGQALVKTEVIGRRKIAWGKKPTFFASGNNTAITPVSSAESTRVVAISEVENKLFSSVIN